MHRHPLRQLIVPILLFLLVPLSVRAAVWQADASLSVSGGSRRCTVRLGLTDCEASAFLITAESNTLTFLRCEADDSLRQHYTRSFGSGGRGSFVFTSADGRTPPADACISFVFSVPEGTEKHSVAVDVAQICDASGQMTDRTFRQVLTVSPAGVVSTGAESSQPESTCAPVPEENSVFREETPGSEASAEVPSSPPKDNPVGTEIHLPTEQSRSFFSGMGMTLVLFAVGAGVYTCLVHTSDRKK